MPERDPAGVLVLGRALHPPWNEGTRVIGRNLARAAAARRPVRVLSLTQERYRGAPDPRLPVRHVYTRAGYGTRGDYLALRRLLRQTHRLVRAAPTGVAHLVGLPLALAPSLRARGVRVVSHITLADQVYMSGLERLRVVAGWRLFDRWVDMYALSSEALRPPLLARGLPPARLAVIPAPLDTALYRPGDRAAARARLGLPPAGLVVLYIGTLSPLRFPAPAIREALVQAAARLPAPLHFFACAPLATHLYNRAWSTAVAADLTGLPGGTVQVTLVDLAEAEKVAWYQAADVVLVPFAAPVAVEPPLTLLEAMACAAPVLVSPHANRSGLVQSGHNGAVFPTPDALGPALAHLLAPEGAARRAALGAAAQTTVLERHSFAAAVSAAARVWAQIEEAGRPCR